MTTIILGTSVSSVATWLLDLAISRSRDCNVGRLDCVVRCSDGRLLFCWGGRGTSAGFVCVCGDDTYTLALGVGCRDIVGALTGGGSCR